MEALEQYVKSYRLEGAAAVGEWIGELVAAAWRELREPPRPAWLIIGVRSLRRRGELVHRFTRP